MVVDANGEESENDQRAEKQAKAVFDKFLVPALISNFDNDVKFQSPDEVTPTVFSGVFAEYTEKLSPISFMGGDSEIIFRSESFLRREPGRRACLEQVCRAMEELGADCSKSIHITYYDNGC